MESKKSISGYVIPANHVTQKFGNNTTNYKINQSYFNISINMTI
jgi:hypothetical protein